MALILSLFSSPLFPEEGERSVISIEQAQKVENMKDESGGDERIVLTGNVRISVSKGKTRTVITAEKINYNRATEMLYAEGNVALLQDDGGEGSETITASSLLFNTATFEGVFDNGKAVQISSDAINLPSGSTLIVSSDVFGRDSGGTIAFKSGELTFCDDENPHWRIKATRIWLLPGGEFAFLNARLFVGRIPLLYLPAFYYPKDELIFNPAFGFRRREGYYVNTTTYLYGRKPADARSSAEINSGTDSGGDSGDDKINFFSFMNTGVLKEQRREGLVLHNLDENFKGDTSKYFKIMADYYANMGTMVGFDGVFAPGSVLTSLATNLELGFSKTVFRNNSLYLPKNASGEIINDKSNFMGLELPFRYQANLSFSIARPLTLNFSMPIYSDPYFDFDFNTRAEVMDWIDFAMNGVDTAPEGDEITITETSQFTWSVSGSYSAKVPEPITPYISTLALSSFGSSIVYSSRENESLSSDKRYASDPNWGIYSPERKFYYPSQVTPFRASGRVAGTLVSFPSDIRRKKSGSPEISLSPPKEFSEDDAAEDGGGETDGRDSEGGIALSSEYLPELSVPSFSVSKITDFSYSLGYTLTPDFTSQFSYSSVVLKGPEDFDWNDMQSSYVQVRSPTVLTSEAGFKDSFLTLTDSFTFEPVYQSHPYLKITDDPLAGGYTESSAKSIKKSDYSARKLDFTNSNALVFKPFYYTKHFSETSLTWNTTIKMIRTKYTGADADPSDPKAEWEYLTTDLTDEDCMTVHDLNLVLGANEFDKKVYQNLSLTMTLPPQVDEYRGLLTLGFPYLVLTAGTGIKQKSSTDDTWEKQDLTQSATLNMFAGRLKFTQSYVYDLEEEEHESLKFALSGFGLQAAYTASYITGYEFEQGKGWRLKSEKEFQPYQLSLAYVSGNKNFKRWSERISVSPSISGSVVYDFLRPTSSYLRVIPALTFRINNFLNITFSMESKNNVIYRYFCSDSDYQEKYSGKGERNMIKDLLNSFRFDDEDSRKSSAFKLQTLKVEITHDLDDWDLSCSFSVKPRLMTESSTGYDSSHGGKSYYDFSPYFSIGVVWRPLGSMKTQIVDEYGEWKLNP